MKIHTNLAVIFLTFLIFSNCNAQINDNDIPIFVKLKDDVPLTGSCTQNLDKIKVKAENHHSDFQNNQSCFRNSSWTLQLSFWKQQRIWPNFARSTLKFHHLGAVAAKMRSTQLSLCQGIPSISKFTDLIPRL